MKNGYKLLTILAKKIIMGIGLGSKYAFGQETFSDFLITSGIILMKTSLL